MPERYSPWWGMRNMGLSRDGEWVKFSAYEQLEKQLKRLQEIHADNAEIGQRALSGVGTMGTAAIEALHHAEELKKQLAEAIQGCERVEAEREAARQGEDEFKAKWEWAVEVADKRADKLAEHEWVLPQVAGELAALRAGVEAILNSDGGLEAMYEELSILLKGSG